MPTGPTTATFGNTVKSRGFDFTFAPGVNPSVCALYTVPHTTSLPQVATLTLKTEGGATLTFRDCLLEDPKLSATAGGRYWQLPIKDRRWKWQYGAVYGHYNKPEANGAYTREKTPRELAAILLDAMGETGYDVGRLPNTVRPERRWDGALPASELDNLCSGLSCFVVLNPLLDRVEIWPVGQGSTLPTGGTIGKAYAPILPAMPSTIHVEAAETLFQATFKTEPVGLDTDGQWKHINSLSYKPPYGWSGSLAISGFPDIPDSQTYFSHGRTLKIRDLAAATVFQNYRVTGVNGWVRGVVPPILAGMPMEPQSIKDLRLFPELAEEEISTADGGLRPLDAVVYARWARFDKPTPTSPIRYPDGFSFMGAGGDVTSQNIVSFNQPLFLWGSGNTGSQPAEVLFECSFFAGATGVFHRRFVSTTTGAPVTTPTLNIQHPEVQARVIYRFLDDGNQSGIEDNLVDTDSRLNYWRDAAVAEYGLQQGGTINYTGLRNDISPDGLTQQITWSGGGSRPAATTVSQAQRHNRFVQPLEEYRDRLTVKRNEALLLQMANGQLLKAIGGGV